MDVEAVRLECGKAIGYGGKSVAHRFQVIESLFEAKVFQSVTQGLHSQETGVFFVHANHGAFTARSQNVMPMIDLLQNGTEFPAKSSGEPEAEQLGDSVRRQTKQSVIAGTLEQFVDGGIPSKDEIPTVLDLVNGIVAVQSDGLLILAGELGA